MRWVLTPPSSGSADNDYGHPHPDVLAELGATRILRTDTGGTVTVAVE